MILIILFWLLWLLCVIGLFIPETPFIVRGRWAVTLILVGIIALKVFGNPMH